jgi:ATP-binding cassette subfamily F protein 3
VAIFGANGQGKTTLLEIIAGRLKVSSGQMWRSAKLKIGFYSQGAEEELDDARTVFEEASASAEGYTLQELRDILGRFLFSGDDIHKRVDVLSGGERTRLAIVKVLVRPSNLLILDEPANHLDIQSREVLEEAIRSYRHTVLFAAHDRFMIDRLAAKTVKVEDTKLTVYPGNYSYAARSSGGLSEPTLTEQAHPGREEVDLLARKREKLREVEEDYEKAKANLNFYRARELWQEYEMIRREIDGLIDRRLSLQDEDGV